MPRRGRPQIFADILKAIMEDVRANGEAKMTRVQSRVYVPFDRFKEYIEKMRDMGLIEIHSIKITEKGRSYLEEYKNLEKFLERFGLD